MSRSRRHTPIMGNAGSQRRSEKWDKRQWHRNFRGLTKRLASKGEDEHPAFARHGRRLVSNPWTFNKDGKRWMGRPEPKWMRK